MESFGTKLNNFFDRILNKDSNENVDPKRNKSFFVKDATGQWWFFGVYSNKFKDRDGEIISETAHKEYVQWLRDTGFKPVLTAYHLPRMPRGFWVKVFNQYENDIPMLQKIVNRVYKDFGFATAEHVNYINGFMTVAGRVLPGKESNVEKLAELPDMGMSHGFIVKETSANIFEKYRTFEMSTLRNSRAANYLTVSRVTREGESIMKSEKGFDPKDREVLTRVFGEQAISAFEMDTEGAEKILSETVDYKDDLMDTEVMQEGTTEAPASSEPEVEVAPVDSAAETPVTEDKSARPVLTLEILAEGVIKNFTDLQAVLADMQKELVGLRDENKQIRKELADARTELKEVKQTEDEKVAAMWTPVLNWRAGYSASASNDNLVTNKVEREALTENAPEGDKAKSGLDMTNPLHALAWKHLLPEGNG